MSGLVMRVSIDFLVSVDGPALERGLGTPAVEGRLDAFPSMKLDRATPEGDSKPASSVLRLRGFGMAGTQSLPMRLHLASRQ